MPPRDPIRHAARTAPEAPALVRPSGEAVSYAAFDAAVTYAARRLREAGATGRRVGLVLPRDVHAAALLWALVRTQGVAAFLSRRLPPDGVARQLRQVGAAYLVTRDAAVRATAPEGVRLLAPDDLVPAVATRDAAALGAAHKQEPITLDAGADATVVFTSGSTAQPKAALHVVGHHLASAEGSNANIALGRGDRWLLSLPLYHVGGLAILFRCAVAGAAAVLPPAEGTGTGQALAEALHTRGVTHVSLVATQLKRLLETDVGLPSLKAVLLGGSALPSALLDAAVARGWPVHTSYGCTEMASQVATTPPGASRQALATAGYVLPHRDVVIDAGGAIRVRGATLFRGYLDATREAGAALDDPRDAEGFYATGDLGRWDEAGRLVVEGRADDLIITGGENVQPREVEAALERLPGVVRAVVVGVPSDEFGARPVAFVETTGGVPDADERAALAGALANALPRFKHPDAVYHLPEDALEGLKPDRRRLARLAAARASQKD